jgi:hypothetical protein
MPSRSVQINLQNKINSDFALTKVEDHLDHGIWSHEPPDFVGKEAQWGSESDGVLTGTAGAVTYEIRPRIEGNPLVTLRLGWDNPFVGSNSFSASAEPEGQTDGSGFSAGYFGGGGDNAEVTFIVLSGKCEVDENTGEVTCTSASPVQPTPPISVPSNEVIYTLANNNDLLWYGHTGQNNGSFEWALPVGQKVGNGWSVKQIFPGDDGVIYAVMPNNDLMWYRHDGRTDGSFRWAFLEGKKVGVGWNVKHVFSGGAGVIYAVMPNNDLMWYRHDGRGDGSFRWAFPEGKKVGVGWDVKHVFSGGNGVIYAVMPNNDLMWYRHDGRGDGSFRWADSAGRKVGNGWDVKEVFSAGGAIIYAVMPNNDLMWYRHDGQADGSFRWAFPAGKKVGNGWNVQDVFSGATLAP